MAGGVFWETDISNPSIDGLGTGQSRYFLILSALLAKATSNQTYLIAAQSSAAFIKAHLYNINSVVQDTISARENDSCSTSGNMWPYNAGLMIEGLATLYSFTQNATMQSLLNDAIVAAVQNTVWVADNGIIASGTQKLGDNMLARGLLVAYSHNATSAEIRTYIEAFLGVQYNAIIDLATANGTNIYTASWSGPPSEQYSASNQITALTVSIGAILLQDNSTSSNSSPISTSTLSPIRSHTTVPVGALIGGIVGGVILLITLIIIPTYLLRHKRQQQIGQSNKNGLVPFMLSFAVTSAPTTQSTRGVTTATNNKVVPHNLPEHRGSFSQTIGTEIRQVFPY
ncbi:uncharacterized protein C8R40DRAFT_1166540 [Lentinula edodes]|uniref:uncharacterized protein n=1 Tax=Lentinula edodes TaxID=5353 RepID=UPI001E8EC315|nr:uncharacterized protein C8R40DRAFT_1166540 [Lentinula edodes]KAH7879298.1 hypothetical protein C8R40DRAFT_1166540 [Lentinula edodes]